MDFLNKSYTRGKKKQREYELRRWAGGKRSPTNNAQHHCLLSSKKKKHHCLPTPVSDSPPDLAGSPPASPDAVVATGRQEALTAPLTQRRCPPHCRRYRSPAAPPSVEQSFLPAASPSLEQALPPSNAAARSYAGDHSIDRASTLSTGGASSCFGIHWRANTKCILVRH